MSTTADSSWPAAEAAVLGMDEVRIVRHALQADDERVAGLRVLLNDDERARADRFKFDVHRRRFTVARGFLRRLLAQHVGAEPRQLRFAYGEQGKPRLEWPETDLRFNLSHSADLAVAAMCRGRELGVDVERIRDQVDLEAIARRFFAPEEARELLALPEDQRSRAFFRCWTRKEAFIKAKGGGLSIPLDEFRVNLGPDPDAALLEVRWDAAEAHAWKLTAFEPAGGFAGAVIVATSAGDAVRLATFDGG